MVGITAQPSEREKIPRGQNEFTTQKGKERFIDLEVTSETPGEANPNDLYYYIITL